LRVTEPGEIAAALDKARTMSREHKVPVVVEIFLERVTNISMGTELDNVMEFEDLAESWDHAPTALMLLD
jgi:tartronate-semialdehyde synthase